MPPGDLSRDELIALVARIMRAEDDEEEQDRLVALLEDSVVHPGASDLIYYPEREMTAEEIVDAALSYRPIELGPASPDEPPPGDPDGDQ